MRFQVLLAGTATVLLGLAMSGCNSAVAGSPTATTTHPEGTGTTSDGMPPSTSDRLAPPVENPKNLRGVDPCQMMSPEQLTGLGLTEAGQKGTSLWGEETCTWAGSMIVIGLIPDTTLGQGLEQAYRAKNSFDNFDESEVDGYPAVRVDFAAELCGVIVGVSDEQTLRMDFTRVTVQAPGKGDPCGFVESVLSDVIKNLPDV
jgi:hypothetical protein